MKQKIIYVCERCGKEYKEEDRARECEKQHFIPRKVKTFRFGSDPVYPSMVILEDGEGKDCVYISARYATEQGI